MTEKTYQSQHSSTAVDHDSDAMCVKSKASKSITEKQKERLGRQYRITNMQQQTHSWEKKEQKCYLKNWKY